MWEWAELAGAGGRRGARIVEHLARYGPHTARELADALVLDTEIAERRIAALLRAGRVSPTGQDARGDARYAA